MPTTDTVPATFAAALDALGRVSKDVADYRTLDDATLLELNRLAGLERQLVDAHAVVLAGEIAYRSAAALGHDGLAQRAGYRTPEELVRVTARSTGRDASTAVRIGRMVREATDTAAPTEPWLLPLSAAITAGTLPIASADAIRTGLGAPTDGVTAADLADAAAELCAQAATLDPDRLFRKARELRDELDEAGIADRERERHDRRSLRFSRQPDGMGRLIWLLDPESAAIAADLYDRATSPRRGGPRFAPSEDATVDRILTDPRSTEQLASDVFLELLRHGADADDSQLLGSGAPVVTVLVTADTLQHGAGHGYLEGQPDPVSIETVERMLCTATIGTLVFDSSGQPLDLGRDQRLHSRTQRRALAVRDGGCRANCNRPPSWTEVHHIKHWGRDGGETNMVDAILLCRHHHLLFHNNHWEIFLKDSDYWLVPPPDIDPDQTPVLMQSKSPAWKQLTRAPDPAHKHTH
jgi:hypothetical protein